MHSRIFQLSEAPVSEDDFMSEFDVNDGDYGYFGIDYVDDSDDPRDEDLEWLSSVLPESIFSCDGDVITIVGDGSEFLAGELDKIKQFVGSMKPEDLLSFNNYKARDMFKRLGGIDFCFYFPGYSGMCTINDVIEYAHDNVGKKLYVGGILDYHY